MRVLGALRVAAGEVGWWVGRLVQFIRRHPRQAVLWLGLLWLSFWLGVGWPWLPLLGLVPMLSLFVWERAWPVSFRLRVADPLFRYRTGRWLRRQWVMVMEACGLARKLPSQETAQAPALRRLTWQEGQLVVTPSLLTGQTIEDLEGASERLRVSVNARRLRVLSDPHSNGCTLVFSFGDPLAHVSYRPLPEPLAVNVETVTLGRTEDGQQWVMPLRPSTLTAGCSGAGKGSVLWGLALSLAPGVKAGLVQLHGIDLKGGMELAMGRQLFARYATDVLQAVVMLEDLVDRCEKRAKRLAGVSRLHVPTRAEPMHVLVCDELASLVAYLPDRALLKRAEVALSRLLSIGRAPGFCVWAFLQDPRKETVSMRGLFTQAIGLRLRSKEEVTMVLGEGAVNAGALCHRIHRSLPGTGFAIGEDGLVVKVRADFTTDDTLKAASRRFASPVTIPIVTEPVTPPADEPSPRARKPRAPRVRRNGANDEGVAA